MLLLLIAGSLFVIATLLPLSKLQVWWVRGLDFPRLQLSIFGVALLLSMFFLLDKNSIWAWVQIVLVAACLSYQVWWVIPYTPLFKREVKFAPQTDSLESIKLITANVLTPNRNADTFLRLIHIHQPDIVVTLESDHWWQVQLDTLNKEYPHSLKCPLDNLYGMHVYSKLPLEDASINFLVEDDVPSMHACVRLPSGTPVSIHFLHPAPPSPTENEESQERDAELLVVAKSVADYDGPVIVTGDLNDVAWSKTTRLFRKISGLLDPRIGRGMFNTFHAQHWFLRWPLDHLFHSKHFKLKQLRRLPAFGSDHFALFSELVYSGQRDQDQSGINTDREDREEAQKMINQKDVTKQDVPAPGQ